MSSINNGAQIIKDGLILDLDAGYMRSYSPNVFPNANDIFGWCSGAGLSACAISRDASITRQYGSIPLKMVISGNDPYIASYGNSSWNLAPAANGQIWTVSVYVKASASTTAELFFFGVDSSGGYGGAGTYGGSVTVNVTTSWTRVSASFTISGANVAYAQIRLDGTQTGGSGITIWWDGLQVERASSATQFNPYYFGDTSWRDVSGNGVNFTTFNNTTFGSANKGLLNFNGSSTYATAPESSLFNVNSFTIECWARTSSTSQNGFLFEKGTVNTQYAVFFEGTQIKIRTNTVVDGLTDLQFTASSYIQSNVWFLVTAIYANGLKRFYINGSLLGTQSLSGGFITNANGMSIGAYGGYSGAKSYYYSGDIAQMRFYNRALTNAEISQNYELDKTRFGL